MNINPQINAILAEHNINESDGIAYLLSVYFNHRPSYTPTLLIQRMNITNILGISPEREVMWNVPLFLQGNSVDKWDWVEAWNNEFGNVNPKRKGSLKTVVTRMKAFFAENPDIRKEDVIEATKMYFRSLTSREYIISSHYFISKGVGRDRESALESWVEKYKTACAEIPATTSSDITSQMQG